MKKTGEVNPAIRPARPGASSARPIASKRVSGRVSECGSVRAARTSASAAIGRLMKKISRHDPLSSSAPPTTGPSAGASSIGTPTSAITRPMRSAPAAWARIAIPTGMTIPPPRPCMTRNAISDPADHARPHSSEPTANAATAVMKTRRVP